MNLPTNISGNEGGEPPTPGQEFAVPVFQRLERGLYRCEDWCDCCLKIQPFDEVLEWDGGRQAICVGCESVKRMTFSRTTEAA